MTRCSCSSPRRRASSTRTCRSTSPRPSSPGWTRRWTTTTVQRRSTGECLAWPPLRSIGIQGEGLCSEGWTLPLTGPGARAAGFAQAHGPSASNSRAAGDQRSQEPALVPASHPESLLRAVPTPWNVSQDVAPGLESPSPKVCT